MNIVIGRIKNILTNIHINIIYNNIKEMPRLNGFNTKTIVVRVRSPKMYIINLGESYIIASWNSSTGNTMNNWIQWEDETITWEGIVLIQDDDTNTPSTYTLKISKNSIEQTIDTSDVELSFTAPAQNVNKRVAFNNTFTSIQDDILEIELKSGESVITEEVAIIMYGSYRN